MSTRAGQFKKPHKIMSKYVNIRFFFSLQATQSSIYGVAFLQKKVNSLELLIIFTKIINNKLHHRL